MMVKVGEGDDAIAAEGHENKLNRDRKSISESTLGEDKRFRSLAWGSDSSEFGGNLLTGHRAPSPDPTRHADKITSGGVRIKAESDVTAIRAERTNSLAYLQRRHILQTDRRAGRSSAPQLQGPRESETDRIKPRGDPERQTQIMQEILVSEIAYNVMLRDVKEVRLYRDVETQLQLLMLASQTAVVYGSATTKNREK